MTTTDPRIEAFAVEARRYCEWALDSNGGNRPAADALSRVAGLYQAALALPTASADVDERPEFDAGAEEARVRTIASKLPLQYYSEQFDPLIVPPAAGAATGDLVDDVSDVFADVRRGLWLFDQGHVVAAVWEWRFSFETHWGRHAICAIRVLHAYLSENGWYEAGQGPRPEAEGLLDPDAT